MLPSPMARHGADWWAKRIEELERSGDAEAIAQRHGVRAKTLVWWRSELVRRGHERARGRMLPVVVESAPAVDREGGVDVVVEIGGARLQVRGAVTAAHLSALAQMLTSRC